MTTSQKVSIVEESPAVDQERLSSTYEELGKLDVRLDPNPIIYGPTRFNNRIAKVRAMLSRVEQVFLQVSEDLHWFKRKYRGLTTLYELEKRELMINDPKCRVGRSQGEREALADVQLRDKIEEIEDLKSKAEDLEILMAAIKAKRTDLKDIQGRMRDQMKMIDQDMAMGARWGKQPAPNFADASVNDHIDSLLTTVNEDMESAEEEEEEEEVVEAVDDHHDPAPVADVLEFQPSALEEDDGTEEGSEDPVYEEPLIPEEDAEGDLPEDDHVAEDADAFLDALDPTPPTPEVQDPRDDGSIEDLISSLADD
jgi:hypothetical protein